MEADIKAGTLLMVIERDLMDEPKAGSRLGCVLVLLPMIAFYIVMTDAFHLWPKPWAEPFLWLAGGIAAWFGLRALIDKLMEGQTPATRFLIAAILLMASAGLAHIVFHSV